MTTRQEQVELLVRTAQVGDVDAFTEVLLANLEVIDGKAGRYGGETALMYASYRGHTVIVQLLLDHGALVGIQNNSGWTALMGAVESSKYGTIQLLMEHKALLSVNNAVLAEYYTKFSSHPVVAASDEQEDSSEDSIEEEEAADPIVIKSICDLIKREQNWRRRLPWLMVWLALNKSVAAAAAAAAAAAESGTLTIQEDVLSHDWVGRRVASYL